MRFSPQNCSLPQAAVGVRSDITSTPDAFIKYKYEKKRLEKVLDSRRHFTRSCNGTETISLFLFVCFFFVCS